MNSKGLGLLLLFPIRVVLCFFWSTSRAAPRAWSGNEVRQSLSFPRVSIICQQRSDPNTPHNVNIRSLTWDDDNLIVVRHYNAEDEHEARQIANLFHHTVRTVNRRDYSPEQVRAWAPDDMWATRNWTNALTTSATPGLQKQTFVAALSRPANNNNAVQGDQLIVGFGELESNGHIDCFYCHADFQGQGVGRFLYQAIEAHAQTEWGLDRLHVEASITARPFFQRLGFVTLLDQNVSCRGVVMTNYKMSKNLTISVN
jgi:putative acetyltransferase